MKPFVAFVALALLATTGRAGVAISTITPASGLSGGGETIHIHGTGLNPTVSPCSQPACSTFVRFGGVTGTIIKVTDDEIVALTPPHTGGSVDVEINIASTADITIPNVYRYDDPLPSDNIRFLVPVAINSSGAYSSSWQSELAATNENGDPVNIAGVTIAPGTTAVLTPPVNNTGAFVFVPRRVAGNVTMTLHVRDTSRDAETFGTDIPVVPETQFRSRIVLPGIPADTHFRSMLRVYGYPGLLSKTILLLRDDTTGALLDTELIPMHNMDAAPDYGQIALDPIVSPLAADHPRVRAEIEPPQTISTPPAPLWAFVSITNNTTQQVTTITPSPMQPSTATMPTGQLAAGHWGGFGTCIDVTSTDVMLTASCAVAHFPRPTLDNLGHFTVQGTYRTTAGPVPGDPLTGAPAVFSGAVSGDQLTLTITFGDGTTSTLHLTFGSTDPCPNVCV